MLFLASPYRTHKRSKEHAGPDTELEVEKTSVISRREMRQWKGPERMRSSCAVNVVNRSQSE
jgi:hypothetical protein